MVNFDAEEMFWKSIYHESDAKRKIVWGATDDTMFNKNTEKEGDFIKKHLDITNEDVVLDYGCGLGRLMKHIAPSTKAMVGLDVSNSIVAMSKKYLDGVTNVQTIHCSGLGESPVGPNTIDKIYSYIVLQHVNKYKVLHILRNIKATMTPGGKALFQFPDLMKTPDSIIRGYATTHVQNADNNCSLHFWTREEAEKLFEIAGWKIVDIIDDEGWETDFWVVAE